MNNFSRLHLITKHFGFYIKKE